jgi:radical SAM protein with 4Fe4S-binding SPASM domain
MIRLQRVGRKNVPHFRVLLTDKKNSTKSGKFLEILGSYDAGKGKFEIKNKLLNHCWKMWHSAVITWDGLVVPCCFDKDAEYRMGNVSKSSFKEVWMSEKYLSFRKQLIGSRKNIEMCKNCTEGTKIWG